MLIVLICGLLILGGSYSLPIQADEVARSSTTENATDTSVYFYQNTLLKDNLDSEY